MSFDGDRQAPWYTDDAPTTNHDDCQQMLKKAILTAHTQERERIRTAFLRAWSKDRGDGERRADYHKDTWQKAQIAIDHPEVFEEEFV